jgi:hypothetical protein
LSGIYKIWGQCAAMEERQSTITSANFDKRSIQETLKNAIMKRWGKSYTDILSQKILPMN